MAGKQDTATKIEKTMLVVPIDEARQKLDDQLRSGQELSDALSNNPKLLQVEDNIKIWRDSTTQMLKGLFNTEEIAHEFQGVVGFTPWSRHYGLSSDAIKLDKEWLGKDLLQLKSILARLDYIPTLRHNLRVLAPDSSNYPSRRPIGSPFGMREDDWEIVEERFQEKDVLYIVLGYQFESKFYDSSVLKRNVNEMFAIAANSHNNHLGYPDVKTSFIDLSAGYGPPVLI